MPPSPSDDSADDGANESMVVISMPTHQCSTFSVLETSKNILRAYSAGGAQPMETVKAWARHFVTMYVTAPYVLVIDDCTNEFAGADVEHAIRSAGPVPERVINGVEAAHLCTKYGLE